VWSAWEHDGFEKKRKGGGKRHVGGLSQTTDVRDYQPRFATAAIRNVMRWKSQGLKRKETTAYFMS